MKGNLKSEKIKEGEGADEEAEVSEAEEKVPSKMETIKAMVNTMKEMNKEDLQGIFSSISEDEVDESLTKAEIARNIVELVKKLDDEKVQEDVRQDERCRGRGRRRRRQEDEKRIC